MSQLEKNSAARQLVTWVVTRADVLFLAYRCAELVSQVYGPLERTSAVLEALIPEPEEAEDVGPENEQWVIQAFAHHIPCRVRAAENLTNGSSSLSPPHSVSQRETTQITQPASAANSPLASPGLTNTNFNLCPGPSTLDPNWQATKPSVRERNAAMFNNELIADVKFVVGTPGHTQTIPAHKYVLATGSSVFYAMFYGGLAESSEEILVPDVDPAAFLILLKYLYCDEIQLEADTILATLYAAKKYIVPHLARACVNYLETSLTAKNACMLLSQSRLFEEPDLMQRCWEVIDAQVCLQERMDELALGRDPPRARRHTVSSTRN